MWTVWRDIGRQDQVEASAAYDGKSVDQTCIQTWMAQSSVATANAADVMGVSGIPVTGAYYTIGGSGWWKVVRVMPKRSTAAAGLFEVQVEYQRKISLQPRNADAWNVTISFSGQKFSQTAYKDKDGNAIATSSGESLDPSLTQTYYDEKIDVSYQTLSPPDLSSYRGYVNSDTVSFTISGISRKFSSRQLLCEEGNISTTLTLGDRANTLVWDVRLSFLSRKDTYVAHVLDAGLLRKDGTTGKATPILDDRNEAVTSRVKLDGSGQPLAVGGTPHFLDFKLEPETALSPLFNGLGD